MQKRYHKFLQAAVIFPSLITQLAFAPVSGTNVSSPSAVAISSDQTRTLSSDSADNKQQTVADEALDLEAAKIDTYLANRGAPLAGYGHVFAKAAINNGLPYATIVAVDIIESGGGIEPCKNDIENSLGYNSCHGTKFKSVDDAINTVAVTLAGKSPDTRTFYEGKTLAQKLRAYNGPPNPQYVTLVLSVMNQINQTDVSGQPVASVDKIKV
jgi:hypothetical protein